MHLDDVEVQALLHGELGARRETMAREHLEHCTACRGRVSAADREDAEVFALLGAVDHPVPAMGAQAIEARAAARSTRRLARAAGIVLALGMAGIAYAAPGSPVPRWVGTVAEWVRPNVESAHTPTTPSPQATTPVGIAMPPGDRLVIAFVSFQAEGDARVHVTDSAEVVAVRALSEGATFSTDIDRLVIDNRGRGSSFDIMVPRTAPWVEILVDGARRLLIVRGVVTSSGASPADSIYRVPLTRLPLERGATR